jgi:O-antigen/teichoic acid export membrane protein
MFNFINGLAFLIIFSIGRIIIISEYGATALGYYAVGLFFAGLVDFALSSLILPLNPNIYKYANDKSKLIKYIILPENLIYRILYYLVFVIIYLVPFVIFIVPKYGPGIVYIDILIFATIFLPRLITSLFFALRKELITMYVLISIIALSLILNLTIAYFDLGMIYIAFTTLITLFLYGQIMHLMGYKEILGSYRLAIKEIFNYLWPLGYALLGYGLLWMLAHFLLYDFMNYYLVKIIQAILFTVWYSPILWKIEKEHKLVAMLWTNLKNRFRKKGFLLRNNSIG